MFDEELDGIEKARYIKVQDKTTLDILLNKSLEAIIKYESYAADMCRDFGLLEAIRFDLIYSSIYADVVSLPIFKEQDIQSFLHITGNNDKYNDIQKAIVGLYSGTLLHLLTERNEKQGKRTIMHVTDTHFDRLFSHVQKADTIILENCTGDKLLNHAAAYKGSINTIIINNVKCDQLLDRAAYMYGKINNIVICDIEADSALNNLAHYYGYTKNVFVSNSKIGKLLDNLAIDNGSIKNVLVSKVDSYNILNNLGAVEATIGTIILDKLNCENILTELKYYCYNDSFGRTSFGLSLKNDFAFIIMLDATPKYVGLNKHGFEEQSILKELRLEKSAIIEGNKIGSIITLRLNPSRFQEILEKYRISTLLGYVAEMKGKHTEEMLEIANKIGAVYESVNLANKMVK